MPGLRRSRLHLIPALVEQMKNHKPNPEIENTARLMMTWLRSSFQATRDMAATLALVNTALIWTQEQDDEAKVRELMAQTTEVIVTMWKAQKAAAAEAEGGALRTV